MFLTELELGNFAEYQTPGEDKSITNRLLSPLWRVIVRFVPETVAPNVLSFAAMLCLVQAWYLSFVQGERFPQATTAFSVIMVMLYWTLDSLDSIHARITGNDSSLTEFFDHACSTVGCNFLVLAVCASFQMHDVETLWYLVQTGQLMLLNKHVGAFQKEYVSYHFFNGPGEALSMLLSILAIRGVFGMEIFDHYVGLGVNLCSSFVEDNFAIAVPKEDPYTALARVCYLGIYVTCLVRVIMLRGHSATRSGLLLCLGYRFVPAGLFLYDIPLSYIDVIAHGMIFSIITGDIVVGRMAQRELHPWVVIMTMISFVSNFGIFVLALLYYATVLFQVCNYTKLPLLTINRNVYCDGIYDMCHIGHMKAFKNAVSFGTRLFVGVCGDEEATLYKRIPIMTTEERCEVVAACKYVYKVIPNAPCTKGALNEEFIKKHKIHVVAHGEEYDRPEDEWYAAPRRLGITRILPRTQGMSTSDLIKRITDRSEGGTKKVEAASD